MDENILESILFGFPESSDNAIVINHCILYAKQYIYLEELNDKKNKKHFNVDFVSYLSHLKNTLKIEKSICINPLGTGDLKCYQSQGLSTFCGLFFIYLLNQSFIWHGSQFSSLFTILQEHMSLWQQCNIFFLHHQVHDALNDIIMTPPWCYNRGTYMSFQSFNQGWTYMSFQSSKGDS